MKKKNIILGFVGIGLVALVAFKLADNKSILDEKAEKAIENQHYDFIPVKTALAKTTDISSNISESGTFKAYQELKLIAQAQGQITSLLVKKTQFVKKGSLLAVIDNSSLKSQTETAQSTLEKAQKDEKRFGNALDAGGVSGQQLEDAQLRVRNAESQLAALSQQARNFKIIAPMDGIVNDVYIETGSVVSPGTAILEIVDITKLNLIVHLNQKDLPSLRLGQKVNIKTDVYPENVFNGFVETINVKTDLSQKIEVGITVVNSEKTPLLAGMYGKTEFINDKKQDMVRELIIPRDAIVGSLQNSKVFVINPDSTVTLKSITIGRIIEDNVVVLNGLNENEQVITAGQINLENGTKVTVRK